MLGTHWLGLTVSQMLRKGIVVCEQNANHCAHQAWTSIHDQIPRCLAHTVGPLFVLLNTNKASWPVGIM